MTRLQRALYLVTVAAMLVAVATLLVPLAAPGGWPGWVGTVQVACTVVVVVGALGYVVASGER